jgi:hypothetical protein
MTDRSIANESEFEDWEAHALQEEQGACNHGIAGPCPICRSDRRADIAERELRETAEELERVRVRLESERLHGYLKDIKFLHRQWSDEKALAGSVLTGIGNVVLRWMSNLP